MYPLVYKSYKFGWIIMRGGADRQPFFKTDRQTDRQTDDRPTEGHGGLKRSYPSKSLTSASVENT